MTTTSFDIPGKKGASNGQKSDCSPSKCFNEGTIGKRSPAGSRRRFKPDLLKSPTGCG